MSKRWFYLNNSFSALGLILILTSFAIALGGNYPPYFSTPHAILGLITLILLFFVQVPLGIYIASTIDRVAPYLKPKDWVHNYLGYLILALAFITITLGMFQYQYSFGGFSLVLKILWYIYMGAIVIMLLVAYMG